MLVELLFIVLFSLVVPYSVTLLVMRFRQGWSRRKTAFAAALPLALLIWVPCIWLLVDASISPKEECGVDACGMAMMFATIGIFYGLIAFAFGLGAAFLAMRLSGKRGDLSMTNETFK